MKTPSWLGLLGWLTTAFIAAAVGALASTSAREFYAELALPGWAPPGWVFGPVWTVLYAMMGVAAWLVWRRGGFAANRGALGLFLAQLGLNALWSWLFFAWRLGAAASAEIVLLWGLILATLIAFWRRSAAAGLLMVPYLMWVSFAAVLCFTLWRLNPRLLAGG